MGGKYIEETDVEKNSTSPTPSESPDDVHELHDETPQDASQPTSPISPDHHKRAPSIASEVFESVPVTRSDRRGWLARVAIVAEVQEPKDYARRTKWFITFIVAVAAAAAPMGSGIVLRTVQKIPAQSYFTLMKTQPASLRLPVPSTAPPS